MKPKIEEEIPFTEDLMREHGILNRVLLIYEEIIKRVKNDVGFPIETLQSALNIIKQFIEDYHEKLEENYLFPIFERHKVKVSLVKTLRKQHIRGREVTKKLIEIANSKKALTSKDKKQIATLLKKFIDMYRPHEAREDTELFPLVRSLISKENFEKLSELFEDTEHELFGKHGFEVFLKKVEDIEKELGIFKLDQFTPKIN